MKMRSYVLYLLGYITQGDVMTMLPFRNTIQLIEMPGEGLLEMLENSVAGIGPDPSGRFLQVSGKFGAQQFS